jgi:hypothetical protein
MHSFKVDNVNYGTKGTAPPCRQGDFVEFLAVQNAKGYMDADAKTIKVLPTTSAPPAPAAEAAPTAAPAASRPVSTHVDRNDSIVYQSSRKDAIHTVEVLVASGAIDLGAKKGAAKIEIIEMHIDKLTARYIEDVKRGTPPEHPVDGPKTRKAPTKTDETDSEFADDDLPF